MQNNSLILVTSCTNSKRGVGFPSIQARDLDKGPLDAVADAWLARIEAAPELSMAPAEVIYSGPTFAAAQDVRVQTGGQLYVVSAGLGLLCRDDRIPLYDLSVTTSSPDYIGKRVVDFSPTAWWDRLCRRKGGNGPLHQLIRNNPDSLVAIALSGDYLALIGDDLQQLDDAELSRVRIFSASKADVLPPRLRRPYMPYDIRMEGPDSGILCTRTVRAQRSMQHYFKEVAPNGTHKSPEEDALSVERRTATWRNPPARENTRIPDDGDMLTLILEHWDKGAGKRHNMHRVLRDDLKIACEQGRFARLFKLAKEQKSNEQEPEKCAGWKGTGGN